MGLGLLITHVVDAIKTAMPTAALPVLVHLSSVAISMQALCFMQTLASACSIAPTAMT